MGFGSVGAGTPAGWPTGRWATAVRGLAAGLLTGLCLAPAAAQQPASAAPAVAPAASEYRLGPGDLIRVTVFQNPELTLEARLTEAGVISYPLLGEVQLSGLAIGAAERRIADGLRSGGYVRQPQVSLALQQVRAHQASVLGMVNRPGRYALDSADTRLTTLLALAGGSAPGGADRVVLAGLRDGASFRVEIDLPAVFAADGPAQDPLVRHGDVVWVDRQPLVYIYGEVQRPGMVRLERGMSLMQALAAGGGLSPRGTERGIRVHRKAGGQDATLELKLNDTLREGDVVFVRESLF